MCITEKSIILRNNIKNILSDCCTSIYGLKKQQVRRQEDNMGKNIDWSNLGFGYVKTDYRYVSNFKNGAWDEGTLSTDDMVTISECACVLQYAQTVFEGMKAYTTEDGRIVVFRPDLNAERMENSAKRLEMPVFPKDRFVDAIVKLVEANADYVPPYGFRCYFIYPPVHVRNKCSYRCKTG